MTATEGNPGPRDPQVSLSREDLKELFESVGKELRPDPKAVEGDKLSWKDLAQNATAVLAICGIVMYSILTLAYSRFYGTLSVSPSDVGLGYVNTLANSVGAVLALIVTLALAASIIFLLTFVVLAILYAVRTVDRTNQVIDQRPLPIRLRDESGSVELVLVASSIASLARIGSVLSLARIFNDLGAVRKATIRVTIWSIVLIAGLLISVGLPRVASSRAEIVQNGQAVSPPRLPVASITMLSIHAEPARVQPVGEKAKVAVLAELNARPPKWAPLLYLGQSGGTAVLYDSELKQTAYVPLSAVLLTVSNCAASPAPAICGAEG